MLPDGRVPSPLVQGNVRGQGATASAAAQVSPAAAEFPAQARTFVVNADVYAPPPVAEHASFAFADAKVSPSASFARLRVCFADPPIAGPSVPGPAEEEDDDGASVTSNLPVVDKTVAQFAAFILEQYPESLPLSAPLLAPHCCFEVVCALSELAESTRPCFRLYPQVDEILADVHDRAETLAKTSKLLFSVLPRRHRSHSVADVTDFNALLCLTSDFSHLAENKTVSSKRAGTITFFKSVWRAPPARCWNPTLIPYGFSPSSREKVSLPPPSLPCPLLCQDRREHPLRLRILSCQAQGIIPWPCLASVVDSTEA